MLTYLEQLFLGLSQHGHFQAILAPPCLGQSSRRPVFLGTSHYLSQRFQRPIPLALRFEVGGLLE